jgi:hypothetical protein
MSADPYRTLGLEHSASISEIKRAYRRLAAKYHPDKLVGASQVEIQQATSKFAAIAAAYSILSDEGQKRRYDHIYKYGGFDHLDPAKNSNTNHHTRRYGSGPAPKRHNSGPNNDHSSSGQSPPQKQKPQMGIGYTVYDPVTFIMSKGQVKSKAVAGVTIPTRINLMHNGHGGVCLSLSSGQIQKTASGSLQFTSRTTQFAAGKKSSRSEMTTIHKDGRKEVVIEGDDYIERRVTAIPKRKRRPSRDEDDLTRSGSPDDDQPWYMNAWNGVRDAVQICNCNAIRVQ